VAAERAEPGCIWYAPVARITNKEGAASEAENTEISFLPSNLSRSVTRRWAEATCALAARELTLFAGGYAGMRTRSQVRAKAA